MFLKVLPLIRKYQRKSIDYLRYLISTPSKECNHNRVEDSYTEGYLQFSKTLKFNHLFEELSILILLKNC